MATAIISDTFFEFWTQLAHLVKNLTPEKKDFELSKMNGLIHSLYWV